MSLQPRIKQDTRCLRGTTVPSLPKLSGALMYVGVFYFNRGLFSHFIQHRYISLFPVLEGHPWLLQFWPQSAVSICLWLAGGNLPSFTAGARPSSRPRRQLAHHQCGGDLSMNFPCSGGKQRVPLLWLATMPACNSSPSAAACVWPSFDQPSTFSWKDNKEKC